MQRIIYWLDDEINIWKLGLLSVLVLILILVLLLILVYPNLQTWKNATGVGLLWFSPFWALLEALIRLPIIVGIEEQGKKPIIFKYIIELAVGDALLCMIMYGPSLSTLLYPFLNSVILMLFFLKAGGIQYDERSCLKGSATACVVHITANLVFLKLVSGEIVIL